MVLSVGEQSPAALGCTRGLRLGLIMRMMTLRSIKSGSPSRRRLVSNEITSASVEEWLTAPCFLQSHEIGTKLLGPAKTR